MMSNFLKAEVADWLNLKFGTSCWKTKRNNNMLDWKIYWKYTESFKRKVENDNFDIDQYRAAGLGLKADLLLKIKMLFKWKSCHNHFIE